MGQSIGPREHPSAFSVHEVDAPLPLKHLVEPPSVDYLFAHLLDHRAPPLPPSTQEHGAPIRRDRAAVHGEPESEPPHHATRRHVDHHKLLARARFQLLPWPPSEPRSL